MTPSPDSPSRITRRRFLRRTAGSVIALGAYSGAWPSTRALSAAAAEEPAAGPARLASMLRLVPATVRGDLLFAWADLATQFEAIGIAPPESADDLDTSFIQITQGMVLPSDMFAYARGGYEEIFGFQPARIDQALQLGMPPEQLTLLRGRFLEQELTRTWTANGYEPIERATGTIWSYSEELEIDLATDVGRFGMGMMNNVTILADGTVVFAPTLALAEMALAVAADEEPSLLTRDDIAAVGRSLPPGLVSAVGLSAEALSVEDDALTPAERELLAARRAEQEAAVGPMPSVNLGLAGITAGVYPPPMNGEGSPLPIAEDAPAPTIVVRLVTASAEEAAQAASVVEYRWEEWPSLSTGQPLNTLMDLRRADASESSPVAALDFVPADEQTTGVWRSMVFVGDLAAFGS